MANVFDTAKALQPLNMFIEEYQEELKKTNKKYLLEAKRKTDRCKDIIETILGSTWTTIGLHSQWIIPVDRYKVTLIVSLPYIEEFYIDCEVNDKVTGGRLADIKLRTGQRSYESFSISAGTLEDMKNFCTTIEGRKRATEALGKFFSELKLEQESK